MDRIAAIYLAMAAMWKFQWGHDFSAMDRKLAVQAMMS